MNKITIILIFSSLIFHNCQKVNEDDPTDKFYTLKMLRNSTDYQVYKYSDTQMISFEDFSGPKYKKWEFDYDSLNKISKVIEYDENDLQISYYKYGYNSEGLISSLFVYNIKNGQESLIEEQKFKYDNEKRLTNIEAYFPQTFKYDGMDIIKHGKVSNRKIWIDFEYSYDNNNNILSKIGMPTIDVNYISKHNIKKVVANWTEYIDNMGIDSIESTKEHRDLIYSSIFEYNENGYPAIEYRNYSDSVDTIEYIYE
jgi:hypothetical protein